MIPSVFVSSTIIDLSHLRDSVRDTIVELGYVPVMSEYGDIGYLPSLSATDSCYKTVRDCQLAVLLVGKRYGSIGEDGLSITHRELRAAKEARVPVITLADQEIMAYARVFDSNSRESALKFPGVDAPAQLFAFLEELRTSPLNNGMLTYATPTDVRRHLKAQIAHLVGELLRGAFSPIGSEVRDILSEIKTLKHELVKTPSPEYRQYQAAVRFLLDDARAGLSEILHAIFRDIESRIVKMMKATTFVEFLEGEGITVTVSLKAKDDPEHPWSYSSFNETLDGKPINWKVSRKPALWMTHPARNHFEEQFQLFRQMVLAAK